eukprot:4661546-Pleurochrysis_carterae.AAC.1
MSSSARRMCVPESLYGAQSNVIGRHSATILSSAFSSAYSLAAVSLTLSIAGSSRDTFCSTRLSRVVMSFGCTERPILALSSFQWRSRMPGAISACSSGRCVLNDSSRSRTCATTRSGPSCPARLLPSLYNERHHVVTSDSTLFRAKG